MTIHGAPPWETLRRIYATIDARDIEIERLHRLVWGAVHNAGGLSECMRPRWVHLRDALGIGSTTAKELCREFDLNPDIELCATLTQVAEEP